MTRVRGASKFERQFERVRQLLIPKLLLLLQVCLLAALGCSARPSGTYDASVESQSSELKAVTLKSISVTPTPVSLYSNATQALRATGTYSDGTSQDLSSTVVWSSSKTTVAGVSAAGVVTALVPGTATITAQSGTVKGKATVKVLLTLTAIAVTPPSQSLPASTTQALQATGAYSNRSTKNLTSTVSWTSSDPTVATVSSAGLVVALAPGVTTISATTSAASPTPVTGTTTITVNTATIKALAVTPANKKLANGSSQKFTATATFSDGSKHVLVAPVVSWSSSTPSVATINAAGLALGSAPGTTTITAKQIASGLSGTAKLTVNGATLVSVAVSPVNATLMVGMTQPFVAVGTFSDGSTLDITAQVTWAVSTAAVASVTSTGLATALAAGSTVVTATDPKTLKVGSATLVVTPAVLRAIALGPSSASVPAGSSLQLFATGTLTDGTTEDVTSLVTWGSSAPEVATVSNAVGSQGLVSALASGVTTITVLDPLTGTNQTETVTVSSAVLVSIAIAPPSPAVPVGLTVQLSATGTYSDGSTADVTQSAVWAATNGALAVSNAPGSSGQVTALGLGSTQISATDPSTGVAGLTTVTETAAVLRSISVTPASASIPLGASAQFRATGAYSDGSIQDLTLLTTWSSSSSAASASNASGFNGLTTATAIGAATITATDPVTAISGTAAVTVTPNCGTGLTQCGATCVDEQTDANNCGACGQACDAACSAGVCGVLVTNTADSGPGSLRDAVASVGTGGIITFAPELSGQTITVLSPISVARGMNIAGPGASLLSISGAGAQGIFLMTSGPVTFSGLTFASGNSTLGLGGGAINNCFLAATLTVTDSVFVGNQCSGNGGTAGGLCFGGAVCTSAGGSFNRVVFKNNTSDYYGGALSTGGAYGALTLSNAQFFGNQAAYGYGGAIAVNGNFAGSITNAVFAQNYSGGGGSSLWVQYDNQAFTVTNSDFVSNIDGVEAFGANVTLDNVAMANNSRSAIAIASGGSVTVSYSSFWNNGAFAGLSDPTGANGNIAADPLFADTTSVDPSAWDLSLRSGSALVDAGDPSILDVDGSRSDIGYFGGPQAAALDCGAGLSLCGRVCANEQTDTNNCGGCGSACAAHEACQNGACTGLCGDGITGTGETCDDLNTLSGDGCSATCNTEPGYLCTGTPSVCFPVCGDALVRGAEQCDDGNTTPGDGCSSTCATEPGYACSSEPSQCLPVNHFAVTGSLPLVGYMPASSATTPVPSSGTYNLVYAAPDLLCSPAINSSALAGAVALVHRGTCQFQQKAANAAAAGAVGIVIYNNNHGLFTPNFVDGVSATIPLVGISDTDGAQLVSELFSGASLQMTWLPAGG